MLTQRSPDIDIGLLLLLLLGVQRVCLVIPGAGHHSEGQHAILKPGNSLIPLHSHSHDDGTWLTVNLTANFDADKWEWPWSAAVEQWLGEQGYSFEAHDAGSFEVKV